MRWRVAVSAAIGLASGVLCWFLMRHFHQDAADFRWALHLAQRVAAGQNPYDTPLEQYPLTAALFALPLLRLSSEAAAGFFWGASSFLLAFGLTRYGYHRLPCFSRLPLLGRYAHCAVVANHFRQRVLSPALARNDGETASWTAHRSHSLDARGTDGLCGGARLEHSLAAFVADAVDSSVAALPAFCATVSFAWATSAVGFVPLSR
jgi:hypothetical protein